MKISWDADKKTLVIDMQGDILISPTGGLSSPPREDARGAISVAPIPFDLQILAGTVVETTHANVAQIEQRIATMLRTPPGPVQGQGQNGGLSS